MENKVVGKTPAREFRINNTAALGVLTAFLGITVASIAKDRHIAQVCSAAGYASGLLAYMETVGKAMFGVPQWETTIQVG